MRTYGEFCPISKAAELFGERWTPLIIRALACEVTRFSGLQAAVPGIPKSILSKRLKTLEDAGVVARNTGDSPRKVRYELTQPGWELAEVVMALGVWSQKWFNREITEERVKPELLMWDMRRRLHMDRLPPNRVVAQVDFHGAAESTFWLVLERPEPSVCDYDPGFGVDIYMNADALELTRIWMGLRSWKAALAEQKVTLSGPPEYTRSFPDWFQLNFFSRIDAGKESLKPGSRSLPAYAALKD